MTHGLFFVSGGTPFSPSTILSANGSGRNVSMFNVPAAHDLNFGVGFAFWGEFVVGGGVGCVTNVLLKKLVKFSTYASSFRSFGAGRTKFSGSDGGRSFGCCNVPLKVVRRKVCFGCS